MNIPLANPVRPNAGRFGASGLALNRGHLGGIKRVEFPYSALAFKQPVRIAPNGAAGPRGALGADFCCDSLPEQTAAMNEPVKLDHSGGRLRARWNAFLGAGAIVHVPKDIAGTIDRDRSMVLASMFRVISVAGLNIILLWAAFLRESRPPVFQDVMLAAAACHCAVMFVKSHRWLRGRAMFQDPSKFVRQMSMLLVVSGCIWGVLLISMMQAATVQQTALVYAVMVAAMSSAVLVAPLSVSLAFLIPVTAGSLIAVFCSAQPVNPFAVLWLISYSGVTGYATIYLNNRLTERAISAIRVEENAEVIKLLLRDFEENASDWLWETDAALEMQHVSARLAEVAERPIEKLTGRFPDVLLGDIAKADPRARAQLAKLNRCIAERSPFRDLVIPVLIHGEARSWQLSGKPILDKTGQFTGYHGVGSDVTAARRSQEQIGFLAHHDSLTKLPNRVLFNEMLHAGCSHAEQTGLALLFLDLDDFKSVNDTMGHATGDALLVAVSERIRGCLREGDVAARLGGDEFAIIVNTKNVEEATAVARRIVERINRPYHFDGRLVEIGVSIGVTMAPKDGDSPGVLLKNADLALYRAKADGRATWRFYDLEMDERVKDRRALQTELRQALTRGEFYLNFQPIIELATQRIVAAEALLRWRHPERGQLSPADFIPIAEGAGLIAPIGAWVLRQACAVAAAWPENIHVSVNLSPLQFRDEGLLADVDRALTQSGLAASRLELEITETALLENNHQTTEALMAFHQRGIGIALDDFGTGYSGLGYLRRFPFDKIKIDRSFIRDLGQEENDASITRAIIGLAQNLNLLVTAEGVETEEQAEFLRQSGCSQAQGFLFHRPLSAEQIGRLIGSPKPSADAKVDSAAE
jgi:diguanylate cyclase (GGDEF)-like protein